MNTPILDEWEALGHAWRAAPDAAPSTAVLLEGLARRVRRRSRQRAATLALEVLVSAAVVWWSLDELPRQGVTSWVLRTGILAFTALVWGFGLWNRRHGWRAEGRSSVDFVRLSHQRLDEGRRSIRFVHITLGVATAGLAPWFASRVTGRAIIGSEWGVWIAFALYVAAMLAWCAAYTRWIAREAAWLGDMERDLASQEEREGIAGA